ncbi:MAG: LysM peptidoglycan-binding domain-containing protein [Lachnospiraceae bacterium]|nr:LysM peptidoglycan-binding domain-containing protein [Lachnospiraceae bacterium]
MIEVIYSEESGKQGMPSSAIRLPRNVRQIGSGDDKRKIYVEDYVMTYIGKLWDNPEPENTAGVLLGTVKYSEDCTYIFVSGAMVAEHVVFSGSGIIFSDESWTGVYESMKEYFNDLEIVGWFLVRNDSAMEVDEGLYKAHVDNFAGVDKLLLLADAKEKEEEFYIYHNAGLERQKGYYIYYEKNESMQAYMVEKKQGKPVDEEVEDKVIGNYRALVQEKREIGSQSQRRVITALYSACTFLAVVVLAIGVTMMNNYDKMKSMEAVLNSLSQNIAGESKSGEEQRPTVAANVVVENVEGNVKPTTSGMTQTETTPEAMSQAEAAAGQSTETQTLSQTAEQTSEAAAETAASVMEPRAGIYHIVEEGETLTAISVAVYHTDTMVSAIKEANGIEDENKIYPGQEIYLP